LKGSGAKRHSAALYGPNRLFLCLSLEDSSQILRFIVNMRLRRRVEVPQCR